MNVIARRWDVRVGVVHLMWLLTGCCIWIASTPSNAVFSNLLIPILFGPLFGHVVAGAKGIVPGLLSALFWSSFFSIFPIFSGFGADILDLSSSGLSGISFSQAGRDNVVHLVWASLNFGLTLIGGYVGGRVALH